VGAADPIGSYCYVILHSSVQAYANIAFLVTFCYCGKNLVPPS